MHFPGNCCEADLNHIARGAEARVRYCNCVRQSRSRGEEAYLADILQGTWGLKPAFRAGPAPLKPAPRRFLTLLTSSGVVLAGLPSAEPDLLDPLGLLQEVRSAFSSSPFS